MRCLNLRRIVSESILIWPPRAQQVEKAMAPHSSTLAQRIPWMEEPGGLPSMGSHRVSSATTEMTQQQQQHNRWKHTAEVRKLQLEVIIFQVKVLVVWSCLTLCDPMGCIFCLRDFPGKNTGVGCHFLLQGISPIQGFNWHLLHWKVHSSPSEPTEKPNNCPKPVLNFSEANYPVHVLEIIRQLY